jgi:antitoxin component YwqK of YwqJK toxin-antitoxin module
VYEIKFRYDNWGSTTTVSYWVNESLKMLNRSGCHQVSTVFDQNGLPVQYNYTDEDGKPVMGWNGFSRQTMQYNEQALVEKRAYFDGQKPVMLTDTNFATSNYHGITYQYDFNNRVRTLLYTDASGKPVDALIKIDNPGVRCQKVEINYSGFRIASENFFDASGSQAITVDCESNNCLSSSGTAVELRKFDRFFAFPTSYKNARLATAQDTTLYAGQLAFLSHDSILVFLDGNSSRLSQLSCAVFYRVAAINKYYQMEGEVLDYYVDNDSVAAKLNYTSGRLSGTCAYFYSNGKIKERGEYKENARIGEWIYYYESGLESKKINFTAGVPHLIESYDESGKQQTKDGKGNFQGAVLTGNFNSPMTYMVMGPIKNGLMDGEWKMYNGQANMVTNIEKFSSGQFQNGRSLSRVYRETEYRGHYLCHFESQHPGDRLDYYGPSYSCSMAGRNILMNLSAAFIAEMDLFDEINSGMTKILGSNKYGGYSGWIFLDLAYDEKGMLSKKVVKLFQENQEFQQEIGNMLEHFGSQSPATGNGKRMPYEKFYILLVEGNHMIIPEQALKNARGNVRQ